MTSEEIDYWDDYRFKELIADLILISMVGGTFMLMIYIAGLRP